MRSSRRSQRMYVNRLSSLTVLMLLALPYEVPSFHQHS
jgi:hypothetical protein